MNRALVGWSVLAACGSLASFSSQAQAPPIEAAEMKRTALQLLPYRVQLNGTDVGDALLRRTADGRLLLPEDGWQFWRLKLPQTPPILLEGERYWALDDAPGFTAKIDEASQLASLSFAPTAFADNRVRAGTPAAPLAQRPDGIGGFINYEAVATQNWNQNSGDTQELNAQAETGLFTPLGVGIGQWAGLNLNGDEKLLRLDTFWRVDDPERITTLQFGDAIGRAGLWGRAVRFGGIQWSRNFSTQPNFISLPQPVVNGESSLPSVLEVYVDGIRRQTIDVPQGPFSIDNIPAVNGQGQIDVVVRDLLGREQLLSLPYLSSTRQLKAGLHDYSYEAGFQRRNFGTTRDEYDSVVATALHRYGFNDSFTGEARLELRDGGRTGGIGGALSIPRVGVVSAAGAASHEDDRSGSLAFIAWERTLRRRFSLGARGTFTSGGFVQSGLAEGVQPPKRVFAANAGFSINRFTGVGIGYIEQHNRSLRPGLSLPDFSPPGPSINTEAVTANLSSRIRGIGLLLQSITRIEPRRDQLLSLLVSIPLERRITTSAGYRHRRDADGNESGESSVRLQRNLPIGEGLGYRLAAFRDSAQPAGDEYSAQAAVDINAVYGSYALEAATFGDRESLRGTIGGGLGYYAGHGFASRRINSGFGIVESGTNDVPLLLNNQLVGRTDANGVAVIPNLQSYQTNLLRIDVNELPLDIELQNDEVTVTPYYRSGLLIPLAVRRVSSALLSLSARDGKPLPAGSVVTLGDREFPVGRDGQAYVIGLVEGNNELIAQLPEGPCRIIARVPVDAGIQAHLGPFVCEETAP